MDKIDTEGKSVKGKYGMAAIDIMTISKFGALGGMLCVGINMKLENILRKNNKITAHDIRIAIANPNVRFGESNVVDNPQEEVKNSSEIQKNVSNTYEKAFNFAATILEGAQVNRFHKIAKNLKYPHAKEIADYLKKPERNGPEPTKKTVIRKKIVYPLNNFIGRGYENDIDLDDDAIFIHPQKIAEAIDMFLGADHPQNASFRNNLLKLYDYCRDIDHETLHHKYTRIKRRINYSTDLNRILEERETRKSDLER